MHTIWYVFVVLLVCLAASIVIDLYHLISVDWFEGLEEQ